MAAAVMWILGLLFLYRPRLAQNITIPHLPLKHPPSPADN